jgi:hypothetical protein
MKIVVKCDEEWPSLSDHARGVIEDISGGMIPILRDRRCCDGGSSRRTQWRRGESS